MALGFVAYGQNDVAPVEPNLGDNINFGLQQFLSIFDWPYIFSVIFLAALLFKFVLGKIPQAGPLSIFRFLNLIDRIWVVIALGFLLGWGFLSWGETTWPKLLVSFPFAVVVHKALFSRILKLFGLEEKDNPGAK